MRGAGRRSYREEEHDAVSHLIWCVKKRPVLYNYKLPSIERRRGDVARGWQELADEIGGNVTAEGCRKRWKNLRDTFHQYRLRKSKFKDCLEKWRYTKDLEFLTDVYQPKLKSKRNNYVNKRRLSSETDNSLIQEVKTSDISSLIEVDENFSGENSMTDREDINKAIAELDEHSIDIESNEDVKGVATSTTVSHEVAEDAYGEVFLYDESDVSAITVDGSMPESKQNILKQCEPTATGKFTEIMCGRTLQREQLQPSSQLSPAAAHSNILKIGTKSEELDLFFNFLKAKIKNLPRVEITAIQIEFLNSVLRREAAAAQNQANDTNAGT